MPLHPGPLLDASRADYVVPRTNREMADGAYFSRLYNERGTTAYIGMYAVVEPLPTELKRKLFAED